MWRVALILLFLAPVPVPVTADVEVSLPLQGYYRPGRMMPVVVPADREATLLADGAVPTLVRDAWGFRAAVPWFPLDTIRNPVLRTAAGERALDLPLRELGRDERLIGVVNAEHASDVERFRPLSPGYDLIAVPIELPPGLPGPGWTWQWDTCDAVVLQPRHLKSAIVSDEALSKLLGRGIVVAVGAEDRPDDVWPWERAGDLWVIRPRLTGPTSAIDPAVYLPVQNWVPGLPAHTRRGVFLLGVMFAIFVVALALLGARAAIPSLLVLVPLFGIAMVNWADARSGVHVRNEAITFERDGLLQTDFWQYNAVREPKSYQWQFGRQPFLESRRHGDALNLRIVTNGVGHEWVGDLEKGQVIATISRVVQPVEGVATPLPPGAATLLEPLIHARYFKPDWSLVDAGMRLRRIGVAVHPPSSPTSFPSAPQ